MSSRGTCPNGKEEPVSAAAWLEDLFERQQQLRGMLTPVRGVLRELSPSDMAILKFTPGQSYDEELLDQLQQGGVAVR